MKPSEMTSEQLASNLEATIPFLMKEARRLTDADEIMTEAAARLRRPTPVDDDLLKMARDIDALRAKLKVAADALEKLRDRLVASVYDGTISPHEALKVAEDALAAIREEGASA